MTQVTRTVTLPPGPDEDDVPALAPGAPPRDGRPGAQGRPGALAAGPRRPSAEGARTPRNVPAAVQDSLLPALPRQRPLAARRGGAGNAPEERPPPASAPHVRGARPRSERGAGAQCVSPRRLLPLPAHGCRTSVPVPETHSGGPASPHCPQHRGGSLPSGEAPPQACTCKKERQSVRRAGPCSQGAPLSREGPDLLRAQRSGPRASGPPTPQPLGQLVCKD